MVPASWSLALLQAREDAEDLVDVGVDLVVVAHEGAHLQVLGDGHAREGAATLGHHHQALLDQVPGALALDAAAHEDDLALGHRLQCR
jgi:hypothetical protein